MSLPSGSTELLALFGGAIRLSPSPQTHTYWAQKSGIDLVYMPLTCESETDFLQLASALMGCTQFKGGNITNPFKRTALQLPGILIDDSARDCGAGNTLSRCGENWLLSNTDLLGCISSLRRVLKHCQHTFDCFILGTGAMSRTVLVALDRVCTELAIQPQHIEILGRAQLSNNDYCFLQTKPNHLRVVVNTLPSATQSEADIQASRLLKALESASAADSYALFDLSYAETQAIRYARTNDWTVESGHHLFETQARESFKLWTNRYPPIDVSVQWQNRE